MYGGGDKQAFSLVSSSSPSNCPPLFVLLPLVTPDGHVFSALASMAPSKTIMLSTKSSPSPFLSVRLRHASQPFDVMPRGDPDIISVGTSTGAFFAQCHVSAPPTAPQRCEVTFLPPVEYKTAAGTGRKGGGGEGRRRGRRRRRKEGKSGIIVFYILVFIPPCFMS